ncbi:MAG TPA: hypothetical protein VGO60_02720 [Iamia sp.]|nr:hypothetical protein [Iamia sp.]
MAGDLATAHAGEARLRATLAAAASAPVAPAWETIRARVLDEGAEGLAPTRSASRPRRTPALVAAAAAVLVLALIGALVVATRPESEGRFTQVGGAAAAPPGWFVPQDLPAGWTITSVSAVRPDETRCPGPGEEPARGIRWLRPDSSPNAAITVTIGRCVPPDLVSGPGGEVIRFPDRAAPVDVDLGSVTGSFAESLVGSDHLISWQIDGVPWTLEGSGLQIEELVAAARAIATAGSVDVAPTGFTFDETWTEPPRPRTQVEVELTTADGNQLAYVLVPGGAGAYRPRADVGTSTPPEHAPDLVLRAATYATAPWSLRYGIVAPGVDVDLWARLAPGDPAAIRRAGIGEISDDARLLVNLLAPASTAEWRELLAQVDHTPVLDEADEFSALAELDVPPPG